MAFEMNDDEAIPDGLSFDDEPAVDLTALRVVAGARAGGDAHLADLVARIERAAEPELGRRARVAAAAGVVDFLPFLARSLRPALVAAAAALVLSVGLTLNREQEEVDVASAVSGDFVATQLLSDATDERTADGRALPISDVTWVAQQRAPDTDALAAAIGLEWTP